MSKPIINPNLSRKWYGWKPDKHDDRDVKYKLGSIRGRMGPLPQSVDLRPQFAKLAVFDQGSIGSCVANSTSAAFWFARVKSGLENPPIPSRLFIYFNARVMEGTDPAEDSGAQIRDGIKSTVDLGAASEWLWPYDVTKFSNKPSWWAYLLAKNHESTVYNSVNQAKQDIKTALAEGFPVPFGFSVYASFESDAVAQSGIVPMPGPGEEQVGGHAVIAVGYTADDKYVIVRNSWGTDWGQAGYFLMPWEYVLNPDLASDFWVIHTVS